MRRRPSIGALLLFAGILATASRPVLAQTDPSPPGQLEEEDPIDELEEAFGDPPEEEKEPQAPKSPPPPAPPPGDDDLEVDEPEEPPPPGNDDLEEVDLDGDLKEEPVEEDEEVTPPPAPPVKGGPPPPPPPVEAPKPKRTWDRPLPELEAPEVSAVPTEQQLEDHIEKRAEHVRLGDRAAADVELALIEETRRALGARNVLIASAALINEARLALEAGDGKRAISLAESSAALSPDLVAAHWMRVVAYASTDWTQLRSIGRSVSDLIGAQLGEFRNLLSLLSRFLILLGMAITGTVLAFVLLQAIKYLRYPAHDFASLWPSFFGTGEMMIVLLILLSLPLVLGLGAALSVAATLALIYAYQTGRERLVSTFLFLLIAAGPGLIYVAAPVVTFHGSLADSMASAVSEAFATRAEHRLRRYAEGEGSADFDVAMVLAHLKRRRGDLEGAERDYRRALSNDPKSVRARNNLGTILYLREQKEAATASFTQALTNEIPEPYLNMASIAAERGDFDRAKTYLDTARSLDEDLTNRYTKLDGSVPTSKKLMEAPLQQGLLWSRLLDSDSAASAEVTEQVWRTVGGTIPPLLNIVVTLGLLGVAALLLRRSDRLSTPCPKCGIPADRGSPAHYCEQCNNVFLTALAVEPALRREKEDSVRRYQVRRRRLERLLALFAGGGQLYSGAPVRGMLLVFLFLLFVGNIALADYLSVHPWSVWIDGSAAAVWSIVCAGAAGIMVIISLRSIWNQR